jgi:hypothetical protein|tara:strand:- start:313 stop:432 length:120 start_codon:yes stop_codon:yes gene_type:complete
MVYVGKCTFISDTKVGENHMAEEGDARAAIIAFQADEGV